MERPIIHIDEEKCDGCGQCVLDCAEGALAVIDGKARLISDVYCDGLGACLNCPQGALSLITREAPEYDEEAALAAKAVRDAKAALEAKGMAQKPAPQGGCPGSAARVLSHGGPHGHGQGLPMGAHQGHVNGQLPAYAPGHMHRSGGEAGGLSPKGTALGCKGLHNLTPVSTPDSLRVQLPAWPVQLQLINPQAPFLKGAHLLLAAHCAGFALPNLHKNWLAGRIPVIACPKLDNTDNLLAKLTAIFRESGIAQLTILRMSVPCCGGLERLVQKALQASGASLQPQCHVAQLP